MRMSRFLPIVIGLLFAGLTGCSPEIVEKHVLIQVDKSAIGKCFHIVEYQRHQNRTKLIRINSITDGFYTYSIIRKVCDIKRPEECVFAKMGSGSIRGDSLAMISLDLNKPRHCYDTPETL